MGIGAFGRTGEPRIVGIAFEGQRASSTCLPERDLVTGKRSYSRAEGKGPKSTYCGETNKSAHQLDVAHRNCSSFSSPSSNELGSTTSSLRKESCGSSTWVERLSTLQGLKPGAKAQHFQKVYTSFQKYIHLFKSIYIFGP
jgi:hypothetical protein